MAIDLGVRVDVGADRCRRLLQQTEAAGLIGLGPGLRPGFDGGTSGVGGVQDGGSSNGFKFSGLGRHAHAVRMIREACRQYDMEHGVRHDPLERRDYALNMGHDFDR